MMFTSAIDVTKAANTLLDFSRDDQQALLEVMADYSTSPEILTAMKMALPTTNKLIAQAYVAWLTAQFSAITLASGGLPEESAVVR